MGDGYQLGARAHDVAQHIEINGLRGRELHDAQRGAGAPCQLLPGHEVGVVLERRHHDLVAGSHVCVAPARRHEVHGFRGATREDQAVGVGDAHKPRDRGAGIVIGIGGPRRQRIRAAVRIGVGRFVEVAQRIELGGRFL